MNRHAMIKPDIRVIFALAAALALSACQRGKPAEPPIGTAIAGSEIGGSFTLVDKAGKDVRWDQFKGHYRMVYFGYTFCPDACPLDLTVAMQGLARFAKDHPEAAGKVQPIFITVDPARDTPARVGEFAAAFSPRLIGLTGSQAQVDGAIKAFKVVASRGKDVTGGYLMDHSRLVYLMGPDGAPIELLPVDKGPEAVATDLARSVR